MLIRLALSWLDRRIDARIERPRPFRFADQALATSIALTAAPTTLRVAYDDLPDIIKARIEAAELAVVEKLKSEINLSDQLTAVQEQFSNLQAAFEKLSMATSISASDAASAGRVHPGEIVGFSPQEQAPR